MTIRKKNRTQSHSKKKRAISAVVLMVFILALICAATVFASPNSDYNVSRSGYYYVRVHNDKSGSYTSYKISHTILNDQYDDNRYRVVSTVEYYRGANDNEINWGLADHTDTDNGGVANEHQYVTQDSASLGDKHVGYHLAKSQAGATISAIIASGETGLIWNVHTNAMGMTNFPDNHDTVTFAIEPDIFYLDLDRRGGSSGGGSVTVKYDSDLNYGVGSYKPVKAGYTFEGWYTDTDGKGTQIYDKNGNCVNGNGYWKDNKWCKDLGRSETRKTLYAYWKEIPTTPKYTVTCIDHHVDGTTTTRTKSNVESGTSVGGWSTFGTDCKTGEEYDKDDGWKTVTSDTTVNIYYKGKQYVCTFDPNGGTLAGDRTHTFTYYSTANCLGRSTAKRAGYTFQGWYGTATGGAKVFDASGDWYDKVSNKASWSGWLTGSDWYYNGTRTAKWVCASDATVYAHWSANTYRLYVDLNKGSGSTTPKGTSGYFDMQYTSSKDLGTPSRTGYIFAGWKIVDDKSTASSLSGNTFKMGYHKDYPNTSYTGSYVVKVQAQWTPVIYYIKFNGNGATSGSMSTLTCKYDQEATLPDVGFAKTGYHWNSWNTKADKTGTAYANKAVVKNLSSTNGATINMYAQWTANSYKIAYKTGSIGSSTIKLGERAPSSAVYDKAFYVDNPTATGYTFLGWRITGMDGVTHYYDSSTSTATSLQGIKATAFKNLTSVKDATVTFDASAASGYDSWEPNQYTVRYLSNAPASNLRPVTGSTPDSIHTYDREQKLNKNGYAIEGWRFTGWNTKADGTGTAYADEAVVVNLTSAANGTVKLYAQWKDVEPPKADADDSDHDDDTDHENNIPEHHINKDGELEYDWTNEPVDVFLELTDNDYIQSYKISKYDSYEAAAATAMACDKEWVSDDHHTVKLYFRVSEEGITRYRVEAVDRSGNRMTYIVRVKIDYTAPKGTTAVSYDGYNLTVDIKDVVEELFSPGGFNMASGVKKAWVEVTDATADTKKLEGVDYASSAMNINLDRDGDNIRTGAHYSKTAALNDGLVYDSDYIQVAVYILDYAGNKRILYDETLSSFYLTASTERALGWAEAWRRGDGGYTNTETGRYTDRLEIYYPDEWIAADDTLAVDYRTYDYDGIQEEVKTEKDAFIAPIYTLDGEYFITVKAYKNGHEKQLVIPIKTRGSILAGIRGRIRVRN